MLVKAEGGEGGLDGGHDGDQGLDKDGVVAEEDLIVDGDSDDLCFREVGFDVVADLREGSSGVASARDGAVEVVDEEFDVGAGEGLEDS